MGNTMLITVTGRKTGRKYSTPVGYYQDGDTLWIVTSRDRTWWRNVCGGAQVDLHLHGRNVTAFAESILDEKAVAAQIGNYLQVFLGRLAASCKIVPDQSYIRAGDKHQGLKIAEGHFPAAKNTKINRGQDKPIGRYQAQNLKR